MPYTVHHPRAGWTRKVANRGWLKPQAMPTVEPDRRTLGQTTSDYDEDYVWVELNAREEYFNAGLEARQMFGPDDSPATEDLKLLAAMQESTCIEIRSLKIAETLLDGLLAPYVKAACAADYIAIPPTPADVPTWRDWLTDGKPEPRKPAEKAKRQKRRRAPQHSTSPSVLQGPHPTDIRGDELDAARILFADDYNERLAQASRFRFNADLATWRQTAEQNDYPRRLPEPPTETAAESTARHWQEVADLWSAGIDYLPSSLPLPNPNRQAPTEAAELPDAPTLDRLSLVQRKVAELIAAGASDRDIERQTRVHRFYALPQVREQIREILSDFVAPDIDATEPPPPAAHRRAILQDARRQLA